MGRDIRALDEQIRLFIDPVSETATPENMAYELLIKSGKDLDSKLEHKKHYHCINQNDLILMLEKADQEVIDAVIREKPRKVIAPDRIFKGNDRLKTNTLLQMRDAGIEFKTI
jgi:adenine-specific DNA-methyltransferase